MSAAFDIQTPGGEKHRHIESMQNGRLEIGTTRDGSVEVVGVHATKEVRGWGGGVARPASRREEVLGTYPAGSRVEQVAW
jgi:hypothetical protein